MRIGNNLTKKLHYPGKEYYHIFSHLQSGRYRCTLYNFDGTVRATKCTIKYCGIMDNDKWQIWEGGEKMAINDDTCYNCNYFTAAKRLEQIGVCGNEDSTFLGKLREGSPCMKWCARETNMLFFKDCIGRPIIRREDAPKIGNVDYDGWDSRTHTAAIYNAGDKIKGESFYKDHATHKKGGGCPMSDILVKWDDGYWELYKPEVFNDTPKDNKFSLADHIGEKIHYSDDSLYYILSEEEDDCGDFRAVAYKKSDDSIYHGIGWVFRREADEPWELYKPKPEKILPKTHLGQRIEWNDEGFYWIFTKAPNGKIVGMVCKEFGCKTEIDPLHAFNLGGEDCDKFKWTIWDGPIWDKELDQATPNKIESEDTKMSTFRVVDIVVVDNDKNLDEKDRILYEGYNRLTDLSDEELWFDINLGGLLKKHNKLREETPITVGHKDVRGDMLKPRKVSELGRTCHQRFFV